MTTARSPLEQLFSAFSKADWREMRAFVRSPLHQTRDDVRQLFDLFAQKSPDFPTRDAMQKAISEGEKTTPDPKKLSYVQGYLQKATLDFLTWQELSADSERRQICLLRAFESAASTVFLKKNGQPLATEPSDSRCDTSRIFGGAASFFWSLMSPPNGSGAAMRFFFKK